MLRRRELFAPPGASGRGLAAVDLLDYFPPDWLLVVDESHMTIPQVVGMYKNDRTRKEILVDFGFRLPSALDNRPLTFEEFEASIHQAVFMSATPGPYELRALGEDRGAAHPAHRDRRPGDPACAQPRARSTTCSKRSVAASIAASGRSSPRSPRRWRRTSRTTSASLGVEGPLLHSEVDTLERVQILRDLRLGVFDVLVGINLLREGIDLPEVTLVAILDADEEGFLRSLVVDPDDRPSGPQHRRRGRHVRRQDDRVDEGRRSTRRHAGARSRRTTTSRTASSRQTMVKEIHDINERLRAVADSTQVYVPGGPAGRYGPHDLGAGGREQVERLVSQLEADMKNAARQLEFERAAALRDEIHAIRLRVLEEDQSTIVARAAENAARSGREARTIETLAPERVAAGGRPGRDPYARPRRVGEPAPEAPAYEVTSVAVLPAEEEPAASLDGVPHDHDDAGADGGDGTGAPTASDWLPGIRDEHEEDGGWQARWTERPTWDRTVTPNVIRRTGTRPPRPGRRRR